MKKQRVVPLWFFLAVVVMMVIFTVLVNPKIEAKSFFVGEVPKGSVYDPNGFMKNYIIAQFVDLTDGRFNLTPFLNTSDPYGDINKDGICDNIDLHIWENVWTERQRRSHRAWCWQVEKKAKSVISTAVTYNQLWKGRRWVTNRSPILVYRMPR